MPTSEPIKTPATDDLAFINNLVDHVEVALCVDPARLYVAGMSNGAGMATWLICQPGNRFAAAGLVSGINQTKRCPAATVPPFVTFHGTADKLDPYAGGDLVGFPLGLPPVEARVADFAHREHCSGSPTSHTVAADVTLLRWACPAGHAAELYRITGGSHSWPGSPSAVPGTKHSVDASDLILDFFDHYHR